MRLRKNLSQAQLAWPELSDSYVSLIESGKRTPAKSVVELLARKLGCSSAYLTTGVTEETMTRLRETLRYAHIALQNGAADEARIHFSEVLAQSIAAELPDLTNEARWGHALALEAIGKLDEAIAELERTTAATSSLKEPDRWAELHTALSRCHRLRGDLAESIRVGEQALEQLAVTSRTWTDAMVMLGSTILAAYEQRGDLAYARRLSEMLIERAEVIGSPLALMAAYWNAAWVAEQRGDVHGALRLCERAIALLGEEDDPRNLSRLRMAYAHFLLHAQPERAEEALGMLCRVEREMASTAASTVDAASCVIDQSRAHIVLGRPADAAGLAHRAIDILSGTAGCAIAEAYTVLGDAHVRLGQKDEAASALECAVEYLEKMQAHRPAARAWFELAELLGAAGRAEDQKAAFEQAFSCMGL